MDKQRFYDCIYQAGLLLGNEMDPATLTIVLKSTIALAMRYCRLKELPEELDGVLVQMAVNRYRKQSIGTIEEKQTVSSITDGQQSVSFRSPTAEEIIPATGFTQKEMNILNEYRRLWW